MTTQDDDSQPAAVENDSFEQALAGLTEIVRQLEEEQLPLEESLRLYESGVKHLAHCQRRLTEAEQKIEVLQAFDEQGQPVLTPLQEEAMSLPEKARSRSRRRSAKPAASDRDDRTVSEPGDDIDLEGTLF